MPPITPVEALLTAVPLSVQQRDQVVRVNLRPDLPPDYVGPITLDELRLQLSPFHWLRSELAVTNRSQVLTDKLSAARTAGDADLDTVEGAADWLYECTSEEATIMFFYPGDNSYWGRYDVLNSDESALLHFIHPDIRLLNVIAWFETGTAATEGVAVLQCQWEGPDGAREGPLALLGNAPERGLGNDGLAPWLMAAGSLVLADPTTGEWTEFSARELTEEEEEEESDGHPAGWPGRVPRFEAGALLTTDRGTAPPWLASGLRYANGSLHRADTGQTLTLGVYARAVTPGKDSE